MKTNFAILLAGIAFALTATHLRGTGDGRRQNGLRVCVAGLRQSHVIRAGEIKPLAAGRAC